MDPSVGPNAAVYASRPLLGDENGIYKIAIVGNSGSGKTTLAVQLSKHLQIPYISLDEIHWEPGWTPAKLEVFQSRVKAFLDSHPKGWVVDGNYMQQKGSVMQGTLEASDVLWLDPPLIICFWRVLCRTFGRLFLGKPPCAAGCDEHISETLSKKSILLWCLTQHSACRANFTSIWEQESAERGKGKWRRFAGWGSSLESWLNWSRNTHTCILVSFLTNFV